MVIESDSSSGGDVSSNIGSELIVTSQGESDVSESTVTSNHSMNTQSTIPSERHSSNFGGKRSSSRSKSFIQKHAIRSNGSSQLFFKTDIVNSPKKFSSDATSYSTSICTLLRKTPSPSDFKILQNFSPSSCHQKVKNKKIDGEYRESNVENMRKKRKSSQKSSESGSSSGKIYQIRNDNARQILQDMKSEQKNFAKSKSDDRYKILSNHFSRTPSSLSDDSAEYRNESILDKTRDEFPRRDGSLEKLKYSEERTIHSDVAFSESQLASSANSSNCILQTVSSNSSSYSFKDDFEDILTRFIKNIIEKEKKTYGLNKNLISSFAQTDDFDEQKLSKALTEEIKGFVCCYIIIVNLQ